MIGNKPSHIEWPTVCLIATVYTAWFALAIAGTGMHPALWIGAASLLTTLYWSLVHEVVHGHPTRNALLNRMLVALPIGWIYAFGRFRDSHLDHHATDALTDPFDDPESWYMDRARWSLIPRPVRRLLQFNNTLLGRMAIGPVIVLARMVVEDGLVIAAGGERGKRYLRDWAAHGVCVIVLAMALAMYSTAPAWWFAAAAYLGVSVLLIRTFIEHQACGKAAERTVIIEDFGPLAFLFLYNNLHVVHHTRPGLAWYRLPNFYRRHRAQFLRRGNGYVYGSYWQVFRRYFFKAKEPVPHPFAG
jgi:fatty acid desaturase